MTLLEEAKAHMEKMREHTDCCGMPIFRRMVAALEKVEDEKFEYGQERYHEGYGDGCRETEERQ